MSMRVLTSPSGEPVAKLIPNQEVEIYADWMKKNLEKQGITVNKQFKEEHNTGWKVFPRDGKAIFAKAFEQFYRNFAENHHWSEEQALERLDWNKLTDNELSVRIVKAYQQSKQNKLPLREIEDTSLTKKRKTASPDKQQNNGFSVDS